MKPRRFIILFTASLAIVPLVLSENVASPILYDGCSCPPMTIGWMLFEDLNRRVPDFWWEDSLQVEEIVVCPHGVRFVFLGEDDGSQYLASIIFLNPFADPRETGLKLDCDGTRWGKEISHFKARYTALVAALDRVSSGELSRLGVLEFRSQNGCHKPVILQPSRWLKLRWKGREVELRGYLDVYMALLV